MMTVSNSIRMSYEAESLRHITIFHIPAIFDIKLFHWIKTFSCQYI